MFKEKNDTYSFSKNPKQIVNIILPSGIHPGLGHTLLSISSLMSYCYIKNFYPVLKDDNWVYGRWADFFEPFDDEENVKNILSLNLPAFSPHAGHLDTCFFFAIHDLCRIFYKKMFIPRTEYDVTGFENIDVAIHVRQGDRHGYLKNTMEETLERTNELIEGTQIKRMFVMTDERSVIEVFQQNFACEILTLCPNSYNGDPSNIRHAEDIHLFLREVQIAKRAKHFIGSAFSQASMVVDIARDGHQVFYI